MDPHVRTSSGGVPFRFVGRQAERGELERLLIEARRGRGGTLILRGGAGIGKTALLRWAEELAGDATLLQLVGVESEKDMAYAGLFELVSPLLDDLERLLPPQRYALEVAMGLRAGDTPDVFLVAVAFLSLLSRRARGGLVVCLIDDMHWLDQASAQVLGFIARRVRVERIVVLFTTRELRAEVSALPLLDLTGLSDADARSLLDAELPARLDALVRDGVVAEARGNPFVLGQLPRSGSTAELAGGFGLPGAVVLPQRVEAVLLSRVGALRPDLRRFVLLAAADPTGDTQLLRRASALRDVDFDRMLRGGGVGSLMTDEGRVVFRHPLLRSAVYNAASFDERRQAHLTLARATDSAVDPDRMAWHLAAAVAGPDESVAIRLEEAAALAETRGGAAAKAAFLRRAVALTEDADRRGERATCAAEASYEAGQPGWAQRMLTIVKRATKDGDVIDPRVAVLSAQIVFAAGRYPEATRLLIDAAKPFSDVNDDDAARDVLLIAWGAALLAGVSAPSLLVEVSIAVQALGVPLQPRPADRLVCALATLALHGRETAAPELRTATCALMAEPQSIRSHDEWRWLASLPANILWDEVGWNAINIGQVATSRAASMLPRLSLHLDSCAVLAVWRGEFASAEVTVAELTAIREADDSRATPLSAMFLAAMRGREREHAALSAEAQRSASGTGGTLATHFSNWTRSVLYNGLGRPDLAFDAAQQASEERPAFSLAARALPELVEAAVAAGQSDIAAEACDRLDEAASAFETNWARGVALRSRALVEAPEDAEQHFLGALALLEQTALIPEIARTELLYGEWAGRHGHRAEARRRLRAAHDRFVRIGMTGFAHRARRRLLTVGEHPDRPAGTNPTELTAQEQQIVALVRTGFSNPEVGERLFLSPRTVEWHLRKVFIKLSITSRRELRDVLPAD